MSSLFELTGKYLTVLDLAEEGADPEVIQDTLESIDDEIEVKADGYANVIKHLDGNIEMLDKEIKRLEKLKKVHANSKKRMKDNLMDSMKATGKQKFKTDSHNFYIKKNPLSMKVESDEYVPEDFFETKKVLDNARLKKYLTNNPDEELKGVSLTRTESVVIR